MVAPARGVSCVRSWRVLVLRSGLTEPWEGRFPRFKKTGQ
jgi:hypothetical protein